MTLADTYKDYILNTASEQISRDFFDALKNNGYPLESYLMSINLENSMYPIQINLDNCIWSGRYAWTGKDLPEDAQPGDIWMDAIEVVPMILIPTPAEEMVEWTDQIFARRGKNHAWMSLRPTATWQFKVFLDLAVRGTYDSQVPPPFPVMDHSRVIKNLYSDVVNVLKNEAWIYALWFNKHIGDYDCWKYAYKYLNNEEFQSLWGTNKKEWTSYFIDEDVAVMCTPETIFIDIDDALESEDPQAVELAESMIFNEWKLFPDVTFRTVVMTQVGLFHKWGDSVCIGDMQFPDCFTR